LSCVSFFHFVKLFGWSDKFCLTMEWVLTENTTMLYIIRDDVVNTKKTTEVKLNAICILWLLILYKKMIIKQQKNKNEEYDKKKKQTFIHLTPTTSCCIYLTKHKS